MSDKNIKKRSEIDNKFKWNIEKMYPSHEEAEKDLKKAVELSKDFLKYNDSLTDSADTLLCAFSDFVQTLRISENVMVYSQMKKDEDNTNDVYVGLYNKASSAMAEISANMSFMTPKLLEVPYETVKGFIEEKDELKLYKTYIENIFREKEHVLSPKEENILAQLSEVIRAPYDIFRMLDNAELKFGTVIDDDGDKVTLTHGNFISFLHSHNRELRKSAYSNVYKTYKSLINTISTNYSFNVKKDVVTSKIRKFPSSRSRALFSDNIPEEVYDNLISVVHEYLPTMYKYVELRKKALGVDELKMYDVYTPLVKMPKRYIPFDEAVKIVNEGLKPLGEEYLKNFNEGINSGWIDIYENEGKSSGAYSFGSYDSMPYVLLNYNNSLDNVFTLAHEMGHSMHSYYTRKNQPYIYGDYSIFVAEVASTVNECFLIKHMLKTERDPEMRKYLLNHFIEEFKSTVFRQTMFAEFEHLAHKEVENGGVLTTKWLCDKYKELNNLYFGPAMSDDEYIQYEWARIPHFYNSFYVYQYATGFSAANAISNKILQEGDEMRDNYIKFLSSGSSDFPVEVLKYAGVDMNKPDAIKLGMETFKELVEELETLI